ncbi:hypothetical protein HBI81_123060 [Parastagonospora nodorum]|nr:hypothetical protein HBH52_031030 [Parastagonospora nodorum]KAH4220606.1 hypothetical protein HBI06_170370 [Parastagonospora nodorum]KAH4237550.1 hypothetical protein HBI05_132810 [Parastagonospora nodorum]KAH4285942.1 hypothetical protein HBI01_246870 [Parastagonospora nodorum]KAH4315739.1 hypothetical protein HBI02_048760 [Parastagonospora nodorum]
MSRGNQRDTDRKKAEAKLAGQKGKNTQSGTQFAKTKEEQAAIMRAKQEAAEAKKAAAK